MPTQIMLLFSLIFGGGQVVVGVALMFYGASKGRWRRLRSFGLTLAGAWLFTSGAIEIFVSGMETSQRFTGAPSPTIFALWRGRADFLLLVITVVLALLALAYPLSLRFTRRSP